MALTFITIQDANGASQQIAVDSISGGSAQATKMLIGAEGVATVLPGDTAQGADVDVTRLPRSATITRATIADTTSTTTLLAANSDRKEARIFNNSSAVLYIRLASGATTTDWDYCLAQNEIAVEDVWTGIITGAWATDAGGDARVVELT